MTGPSERVKSFPLGVDLAVNIDLMYLADSFGDGGALVSLFACSGSLISSQSLAEGPCRKF